MKNIAKYLSILLVFVVFVLFNHSNNLFAQSNTKKIGLCLSGGGARGLAHIGLLKLIDSLEIKIDYITGTSMGSVVGALYACGYTGKQIDSISRSLEWEKILSRYVPMDEIFIDEKDEYMRYIAEIPIYKGKANFTGLIDGQELLNLFTNLTQHVAHIKDFDKLPIPYHCMGVDIITVQAIEIKSGNLALAMRASMSIPTIFKPVKSGSYLLVDGGVLENFPVNQVKNMGADFIIGSYTGGKLLSEEELNTLDKVLVQTTLNYSIERAGKLEKECNIINNLTKGLGNLNAGSFSKSVEILDSGNSISANCLPQLIELAAMQKKEGRIKEKLADPILSKITIKSIEIDSSINGNSRKFIESRINKNATSFTSDNLNKTVKSVYGSRNFAAVYYELFPENDEIKAVIQATQDYSVKIKPSLHFDTERGTGLILNATFRNFLGKKSRFLITADIAQAPKIRLHYRKYFNNSNYSINAIIFGEKAEQRIYQDRTGKATELYTNSILYGLLGVSAAINPSTLVSVGLLSEIGNIKPKLESNLSFDSKIKQAGFAASLIHNTLNQPYFTKKGLDININYKLAAWSNQDISVTYIKYDSVGNEIKEKGKLNLWNQSYLKNSIKINYFAKINNKLTLNFALYQGLIFDNLGKKEENTIYKNSLVVKSIPINDYFYIGGTDQRSRPYLIGLAGIKEGELLTENFNIFKVGFQFELIKKLYLTGYSQYYTSSSSPSTLYNNLFKWDTNFDIKTDDGGGEYASFLSYCGSLGYLSPLGPINVYVSKASYLPTWRFYFSFGFKF